MLQKTFSCNVQELDLLNGYLHRNCCTSIFISRPFLKSDLNPPQETSMCAQWVFREMWEEYYSVLHELPDWLKKPTQFIVDSLSLFKNHKSQRILDLGCGAGKNSIYLGKEGFDVVGLDISRSALKKIKARRLELQRELERIKTNYASNHDPQDRETIEILEFLIAEYKFILKEID
jgi:SAM-dependent methyltransferase